CSSGSWGACVGAVAPSTETCNGVDDNCDGTIDEGCSCTDGTTQACGSSVGECKQGTQICAAGAWGACVGEVTPTAELCNGLDDTADLAACPAISVTLYAYSDPLNVSHGKTSFLNASITPADTAKAWARSWTVIDAQPTASCAVTDLALSAQTDTTTSTQ